MTSINQERRPRAVAAPVHSPPRFSLHAVSRVVLAGGRAAAGAMLLACTGGGVGAVNAPPQARDAAADMTPVRGGAYALRTVDGTKLPARFSPLDEPAGAATAHVDSGTIVFDADARARTMWYGAGARADGTRGGGDFRQTSLSAYVQEGAQVLIYSRADLAPDTGTIAGKALTVRAQFYRGPSRERHVVVMEYTR